MIKPVTQILMIEDNAADALLLEEALRNDALTSYKVTVLDRLEAGLRALNQRKFDVVLLDLGLPDSQGLETFERIHREFPDLPIVVLSGMMNEQLALKAVQAGAQDYLVKGPTSWEIASRAVNYAIERQLSQIALREREEQYRLLFENAPIGILSATLTGEITEVNAAALQIVGSLLAEPTKSINLLHFPPFIESGMSADFQRCVENARPFSAECPYTTKWGKSIFIKYHINPVLNAAGKIILVQAIIEDITARKQTEEALRQSEEQFRSLFRAIPVPTYTWQHAGEDFILIDFNETARSFTNGTIANLVGIKASQMYQEDAAVLRDFEQCFQEKAPIEREMAYHFRSGGEIKYLTVKYAFVPPDLVMVHTEDITERKQAEQAVRESESRLHQIASTLHEVFWLRDTQTLEILYVNPAYETVWGRPCSSLYENPTSFLDAVHPDDKSRVMKAIEVQRATGTSFNEEYRIVRPDGSMRWVWGQTFPIRNESGQIYRIAVAVVDITERKQAEEALRASEARYRAVVENQSELIVRWQLDGKRTFVNEAYLRCFGLTYDQAISTSFLPLVAEGDRSFIEAKIARLNSGQVASETEVHQVTLPAGRIGWQEWTDTAIRDDNGEIVEFQSVGRDVSERIRAEQALRESEERFRTLIEQSSEGIVLVGEKGEILEWNQGMEQITGIPKARAIRLPVWEIQFQMIPSEQQSQQSVDSIKGLFSKVLQTGDLPQRNNRIEVEIQTADGERKVVTQTIFTIKTLRGYRIGSIVLDITERKRAEAALRASEEKYRLLFENAPVGIFQSTPEGRFINVNPTMAQMFRYGSPEELISQVTNIGQQVHVSNAQREKFKKELEEHGEIKEDVNQNYRKDRSIIWTSTNARAVKDESGNIQYYEGFLSDITERKLAEIALRESEKRFSSAFEYAPIGMALVAPDGRWLRVNRALCTIVGYSEEELLMKTFQEITHPDDLEMDLNYGRQMAAGEIQTYQMEKRYIHKSGQIIWVRLNVSQVHDNTGKPVYCISQIEDITERKRAEEALQESEERFRSLSNNATIGLYRTTPDGHILMANPAAVRMLGFESFAELAKRNLEKDGFEPNYSRQQFRERLERDGTVIGLESEWTRKDGKSIFIRESAAAIRDHQGQVLYYDGTFEDITERKLAEQQLKLRVTELEALHQSGIALSQTFDRQDIGEKVIEVLATRLNWHHASVRVRRGESDELELVASIQSSKSERDRLRTRSAITRVGQGMVGWVIQNGKPLRIHKLEEDSRYIQTFPGMQSGLYVPMRIHDRTIGCISVESDQPNAFTEEDERLLLTLATQAAIAMDNSDLFIELQHSNIELASAYNATIEGWSNALDLRDKETEGHTLRVTTLTVDLARAMGFPEADLIQVRRGALLHDIGKMGVPDHILLKTDELTDEEWQIMRQHPIHAYNLLSRIDFLHPAIDIPHHHHEHWDGTGYPDGLKGEQIPLTARIFAVVDVWDALTSDRPYRKAWSKEKSLEYISAQSGKYFDPQVVEEFLKLLRVKSNHRQAERRIS